MCKRESVNLFLNKNSRIPAKRKEQCRASISTVGGCEEIAQGLQRNNNKERPLTLMTGWKIKDVKL